MKKFLWYGSAVVAVVAAIFIGYTASNQPTLLKFDGKWVSTPLKHELLADNNYSVEVASGSNAIYSNADGQKLFINEDEDGFIKEIQVDTDMSETSNMSVYGDIQLGDPEEKVAEFYGNPRYDLGRGKLYVRRLSDTRNDNIYIGVMDGKVIHIEIIYE